VKHPAALVLHSLGDAGSRGAAYCRSKASGCEGWIFAEPCDLSSEAIRAKEEAKTCGNLLRRNGYEGQKPQGFLVKKGNYDRVVAGGKIIASWRQTHATEPAAAFI